MKQAKKIFTRMCLNNWGGINHKILEFHEYVNLFSGKSGSGKSTVMDAIQVILYGSFSPSFLNKAADDAKNRRSVLSSKIRSSSCLLWVASCQINRSFSRSSADCTVSSKT